MKIFLRFVLYKREGEEVCHSSGVLVGGITLLISRSFFDPLIPFTHMLLFSIRLVIPLPWTFFSSLTGSEES
jgi:hypothetical protein